MSSSSGDSSRPMVGRTRTIAAFIDLNLGTYDSSGTIIESLAKETLSNGGCLVICDAAAAPSEKERKEPIESEY